MDCVVLSSLRAILTLIEKYVNSEGDINMHTSDAELNMNIGSRALVFQQITVTLQGLLF